jgi:uncharacterized membrane protein YagU involved in acid resistance
MHPILRGAIAGTVATAPMTLTMVYLFRRLPKRLQYPLPPVELTHQVAARAQLGSVVSGRQLTVTSLAAHFAYGAATGAVYAPLTKRLRWANPVVGMWYGVAVWMASYLGWIPAARLLRLATEHPKQRNVLMIAAHLVWGATLGLVTALLSKQHSD